MTEAKIMELSSEGKEHFKRRRVARILNIFLFFVGLKLGIDSLYIYI